MAINLPKTLENCARAASAFQKCNCEGPLTIQLSQEYKLSFDSYFLIKCWKIYGSIHGQQEKNEKLKQTKYFIQYLKKLQFRNNKYNFKYCHNITCYLIMMIQNGWLNVFENFQLLVQALMIKYATYSWSNSVNNAQSVFFFMMNMVCVVTMMMITMPRRDCVREINN